MSYTYSQRSANQLVKIENSIPYYQEQIVSSRYKLRPDTYKRKKPKDLKTDKTGRTVYSASNVLNSPAYADFSDYGFKVWDFTVLDPYVMGTWSPFIDGVFPSRIRNRLQTMMLLDLKSQKANLSVTLKELPKTANMVSELARDAMGFLRSLRRGNLKGVLDAIKSPRTRADKALANRWLMYQYGIIPTILEVNGLCELMNSRLDEGLYIGSKKTFTETNNYSDSDGKISSTETYKITGYARVDSTSLRGLAQTGISNPAAYYWETVPYSFVADWFVGIGDYLSTLDALVGLDGLTYQITGQQKIVKETKTLQFGFNTQPKECTNTRRVTTRGPLQFDVQALYPDYKPHLSLTRMLNATALFRNLFK